MRTLPFLSTLLLVSILFFGCSSDPSKLSPNESALLLRQFAVKVMLHAAMTGDRYPERIDILRDEINEDERLAAMVASQNFEYHVSGLDLGETGPEAILATYDFPNQGRMVLFTGGHTRWEGK